MRRMLLVLISLSLGSCQPGMAGQDEILLQASVGPFTWNAQGPTGTAVLLVSRLRPSSVKLYTPTSREPIPLSPGRIMMVGTGSRVDHHVGWYLLPGLPPVAGDYFVEAILGGRRGRRVQKMIALTDSGPLSLSNAVRVDQIKEDRVEASWSPVAGARLYGATIQSSLDPTQFTPRDVRLINQTIYTEQLSASVPRIGGRKPRWNRVALYAFSVDFTQVPFQLSEQFKVSWTLSDPFQYP